MYDGDQDGSTNARWFGGTVKRLVRSVTRQVSMVLTVAVVATLGAAAHAQVTLPTIGLQERAAGAATLASPPLPQQLDEARAQLRQAQKMRDQQATKHPWEMRQDLVSDKQRLLDWLVDLQREKTKRLEELLVLRNIATAPLADDPLIKALQGTPPYSALHVDALRDEIDGLKEKQAAAEASLHANQTEMQNLHKQFKSRAATSRQTRELTLGTGSEALKAKDELEVFALLKRSTEVEIAIAALEQERLKFEISIWRSRIEKMQSIVTKVLPDQRLSQEDLATQRQRVHSEHEKLILEIASAIKQNAKHRAERDRLDAGGQATADRTGKRGAFLDQLLKTDNVIQKGLDHLQILNSVSGDAWEKRYAILSSTDTEQRRSALAALDELVRKLADLRNQSRTRQDALQTETRAQRIRIDNLTGNRGEQGFEKDILNLLLHQTAMNERVEVAAVRLEKQVSRWLADAAEPGDQSFRGRTVWVRDHAVTVLRKIWQQELFVAEDVSEVDGRQVTVKHGITVGKSVGFFVVFFLGYGLLARISSFIQHQLVRRLRVSHQLASVIRRWSMIALSLCLLVLLLNLARIPLSVFAFLGGTLAIGVGFGTQTIIRNFISGLIMLFERKVRVGDVVELGGVTGHVTAVDLRATTVHGFNGIEALIPNANFIENQVINWTYSNRQLRRELPVEVAYGTNVSQAEALFLAATAEHPHVLRDPAPEVFFDGFGDSALKIVLVYWVEFENPMSPRRVDSDLRHDIYGRLAASGISIPFPQRVVHVNFPQSASATTILEPFHAR